jgi:dienelactone hydrolase
MVFAPTLTGFGDRMETLPFMTQTLYSEYGDPMWLSSCRSLSLIGMLLGKTTNGMRVWDVMRTIDYIQSRSESFIDGVGCMGLSGGGMTTMYASAVEPRISVSVVNGYFSTFRDSIMSVFHCTCNYIPEIVKYAEMSDIAGLIAPRPLLVVSGTEDDLFPVGAVEAGFAELQKIYGLLDVPEKLDKDIYKGGHRFSDNKVFNWFDRWLK